MARQQVVLVVGASRGIGRQVAIDLAKAGYAVVIAAKTTSDAYSTSQPFPPDPNSAQSTISTVEREIRESGGLATAIRVDTRDPESVNALVNKTIELYSRLDVLIYNSGAIWWASVEETPLKRFQLMQRVNPEGLYATIQAALPHLKTSLISSPSSPSLSHSTSFSSSSSSSSFSSLSLPSGRIIVVSPPIYSRFFRGKTAYAMGKVSMSVLTKGLAMDFQRQYLSSPSNAPRGSPSLSSMPAITSIWPAVAIQSAATQHHLTSTNPFPSPKETKESLKDLRRATIFSDAILAILRAPAEKVNGELLLDEDFLRSEVGGGIKDFDKYSIVPSSERDDGGDGYVAGPRRIMPIILPDLSVAEQDDEGKRMNSAAMEREKAKI